MSFLSFVLGFLIDNGKSGFLSVDESQLDAAWSVTYSDLLLLE